MDRLHAISTLSARVFKRGLWTFGVGRGEGGGA
jgi:hypothetical protein